jgi:hypothetical protein
MCLLERAHLRAQDRKVTHCLFCQALTALAPIVFSAESVKSVIFHFKPSFLFHRPCTIKHALAGAESLRWKITDFTDSTDLNR